jgi:hypothetical protein
LIAVPDIPVPEELVRYVAAVVELRLPKALFVAIAP